MAYSKSNTTNISFTSASASQTLSTKAKEIVLSATQDCYVSFDSTTATTSNGLFIGAKESYVIHILYPAQISVIRSTDDGTLSVLELGDSIMDMRVTYSATYTGDTNLTGEVAETFTSNNSLLKEISATFLSDCFLSITQNRTFTGDSNLKREYDFTGDSKLEKETSATITGDANLLETISTLAFTSNAILVTS